MYDTPFTRETDSWGARTLVSVQPRHPDLHAESFDYSRRSSRKWPTSTTSPLSVVSYNVLADSNSVRVRNCTQAVVNWGRRREVLLKEIFSVRADVLCLQDVDSFHHWWGPQLTDAGYDSLFKQRTSRGAVHRDGVVIAWKRDVFDLFRSGEVELNRLGEDEEDRSLAGKAAASDNVALMALLQPWESSDHPSGACIVCTQLHEGKGDDGDAVRSLQARGLTRMAEAFNADFTLPVVLCGTMNCVPSSGTYEILCRGVAAQDPSRPGAPGKPLVEVISTSASRLRWAPSTVGNESLSPSVDTYRLLWVPGGSRFLPGESVDAHEADCVVYDLVETESGNVRSEQNPLRSFTVTGLSSGVAYEFRVSAINSLGQGPWSERSDPVRMPYIAGNDPEDKVLLGAASIKLLRKRELENTRRRNEERLANPRAYEVQKLIKIDGLVDLDREDLHPFDSVSGLTPRYSDAMLHPDSANVRTDTGFPTLKATGESPLLPVTKSGVRRQILRKSRGDANNSRACHGTRFDGDRHTSNSSEAKHPQDGSSRDRSVETDVHGSSDGESCCASTNLTVLPADGQAHAAGDVPTTSSSNSSEKDRSVLLRLEALNVSGARSERQKHALGLKSAYMSYTSGGEPAYTTLSDTFTGTVDYIFFSADCLLPLEVLSIPEIGSLQGRDMQQTELVPTPGDLAPSEWRRTCDQDGYMGEWPSYLRENPLRVTRRIPNELFPSDHLMLMANLVYFEPRCASTWR
ncbi:unnamed protein product [Scytosiphon promiscuus]